MIDNAMREMNESGQDGIRFLGSGNSNKNIETSGNFINKPDE